MTIGSWLAAAIVLAAASPAYAQRADADALFLEGKRLLKEGKIAEACDKLEASEHLESSVGTLLNLGDCREKNKQPVEAWAAFRKAAADAKRAGNDSKRETEARRRASVLEKGLDYLTITIVKPADQLVIKRDDTELERDLWNQAVPVDPGTHRIRAEAPGYKPFQRDVTIDGESKRSSVEIVLEAEPAAHVAHAVAPPPPAKPVSAPAPAAHTGMSGKRKAAIVLGAVGIVSIGTSIALGLHATSLESRSDDLCKMTTCTSPDAVTLNADARRFGLYANLGFAVGGAAAVSAIALWMLGGSESHDRVAISPLVTGAMGAMVRGRF